jgi:hypothetical protein
MATLLSFMMEMYFRIHCEHGEGSGRSRAPPPQPKLPDPSLSYPGASYRITSVTVRYGILSDFLANSLTTLQRISENLYRRHSESLDNIAILQTCACPCIKLLPTDNANALDNDMRNIIRRANLYQNSYARRPMLTLACIQVMLWNWSIFPCIDIATTAIRCRVTATNFPVWLLYRTLARDMVRFFGKEVSFAKRNGKQLVRSIVMPIVGRVVCLCIYRALAASGDRLVIGRFQAADRIVCGRIVIVNADCLKNLFFSDMQVG